MTKPNPKTWSFPAAAIAFLKELRANNNREWFQQNKTAYDKNIKQPAGAFCDLMIDGLERLTGRPHAAKVFRIHRDVRFSKDKTPYNAHLHISFVPKDADASSPSWMFGVDPDQCSIGGGTFGFDKPTLEAYRTRVAGEDGIKLNKLLRRLERGGVRVSEPELKRVPRGFEDQVAAHELLRRKGLTAWIEYRDAGIVTKAGITSSCLNDLKRLRPLFDWLGSV